MTLQQFFTQHPKAALAFSGGSDSAYLLWAGRTFGQDVRPYYVSTPFQPAWEREDAQRLARELGVPLTVVELDVLACPEVAANPANRCYFCKKALFSALWQRVRADGFSLLLDGTNASDDAQDRPGMRALSELEVRSPLRECGVTKAQLRALSREAGLFTWDKPAYACLAPPSPPPIWPGWRGARTPSLPWASPIFAFDCGETPPSFNCPWTRWTGRWPSMGPF